MPPVFRRFLTRSALVCRLAVLTGLALSCRAAAGSGNYAQVLVDELMRTERDIAHCALIQATSGSAADARVIASSDPGATVGGRAAAAISTDTAVFGRAANGDFEGILTLYDRNDQPVGAIVLAGHYANPADEARFVNLMTALRNGLKVKIPYGASLTGPARPPAKIYAQFLMERMLADNPELIRCSIHAIPPLARVVNSMNIAYADVLPLHRVGGHSDHDEDFGVITTGRPLFYFWDKTPFNAVPMYKGALPLYDRRGVQIGAFILGYVYPGKEGEAGLKVKAAALRDSLKLLIPDNDTLFTETVPPAKIRMQVLLETETAAEAAVVRCAVYAPPPGGAVSSTYEMAATDSTSLGQPADTEVFDALTTGSENWVAQNEGKSYRGILPLYDRANALAGVLVVDLKHSAPGDEPVLAKNAIALRDRLKAQLAGPGDLFAPVGTMAPPPRRTSLAESLPANSVEKRIYSQVMVDETLAANPDLAAMEIYARKAGASGLARVAASNRALGEPSGPDETAAWMEGKTARRPVSGSASALEIVLPLKTAPGKTIGAVTFVFKDAPGLDQAGQLDRAAALRDMLAGRIPSTPSLFRIPAPWMSRQ